MANNGTFVGIDPAQIDKLIGALERLNNTLDAGDADLKRVNSQLKQLANTLKSAFSDVDVKKFTRQLQDFFRVLDQASAIDISNFADIGKFLKLLAGTSFDGLKELTKNLKALADADGSLSSLQKLFKGLSGLGGFDIVISDSIKKLPSLFEELKTTLDLIAKVDVPTEIPVVSFLSKFASTLKGLKNFDGDRIVKLIEQVKLIFSSLNSIDQSQFDAATKIAAIGELAAPALNSLKKFIESIIDAFKVFQGLKTGEIIQTTLKMGLVFGFVGAYFALLQSIVLLPQGDQAANNFKSIGAVITSIVGAFSVFQNINIKDTLQTAGKLFLSLASIIAPLALFITFLGKLNLLKDGLKLIENLALFFKSIPDLLLSIQSLNKFSFPELILMLGKAAIFFFAIKSFVLGFIKSAQALGSVKDISTIAKSFQNFAEGLIDSTQAFVTIGKIPFVDLLLNIAKFSLFFNNVAGKIRDLIKSVAKMNPAALQGAARAFQGIGEILSRLTNASGSGLFQFATSIGNTGFDKKLTPIIEGIKRVINVFTSIKTKKIPKLEVIQAIQGMIEILKSFSALTTAAESSPPPGTIDSAFMGFFNATELIKTGLKSFTQLGSKFLDLKKFQTLAEIIKQMSKLSGIDFKFDINKFIDTLITLSQRLKKDDLDFSSLKKLKNVVKDLANIFKPLEKLKLQGDKLQGIGKILEELNVLMSKDINSKDITIDPKIESKPFEQKLQKVGEGGGSNVAEGVFDGLMKFDLFQKVTGFLGTILKTAIDILNPLNILSGLESIRTRIADFFKNIGDSIRQMGDNLINFGQNLISNFGIGNILGSSAFQGAADFDAILTQLQVFGNLTDEQLVVAQDFANQIGVQYPLSSTQAAEALLNLQKAGLDLNSAMNALPAAADLAALTSSGDINLTSQAIISATSTFSQFTDTVTSSFDNASTASDIFARAANASTASVESLIEGVNNVGPAAEAFGLSLEETNAILAIFSNNGITGAEAGTALRSTLNSLQSNRGQAALRNLGISLFDAQGNMRSINDIINDVSASLDGMTEAQRNATLSNLADTFGRQGLQILLSQGEDGINNFIGAMNEIPGASEQAAELLNNFKGDVTQLQGSFESLLNRALLPLIQNAFRPMVQLLRFFVDGFASAPQPIIDVIANAVLLVSTLLTLIGVVSTIVGAIISFGGAIFTAVGAVIALATSITTIVSAIVGFIVGFTAIVAIGAVVIPIITAISSAFTYLIGIFKSNSGGAQTALSNLGRTIQTVISRISQIISLVGSIGGTLFGDIFNSGNVQVGQRIAGIIASINNVFVRLSSQVNAVLDVFRAFRAFLDVPAQIASSIGTATDGIDSMVNFDAIQQNYNNLLESVANNPFVDRLFGRDITGPELRQFFTLVVATINEIKASISQIFGGLSTIVSGNFDEGFSQIKLGASRLAGQLLQIFQDLTGFDLSESILAFDSGNLSAGLSTLGETIMDGLRTFIFDHRDFIADALTSIFRFILPTGNVSLFANLLGLDSLGETVGAATDFLTNTFGKVVRTILNLIGGQDLFTAMLGAGFTGGEVTQITRALSGLQRLIGNIVGLFTDLFAAMFPPSGASQTTFIESAFDAIATAFEVLNNLVFVPLRLAIPLVVGLISTAFRLIGNIAGTLIPILQSVVAPLANMFTSLADGTISLNQFLAGLLPAIASTLGNLITNIPAILGSILTGIGLTFGSDFFTTLGTELTNGDFSGAFNTIATAIGSAITSALALVPTLLTDLGTLIGSPLLTTLGEQLAVGDFSGAITTIGAAFVGVIISALTLVPTLITGLGESLGIPLLETIGTQLAATDFSGAISSIGELIAGVVTSALGSVPELLTNLGQTFDIQALIDFGNLLDPAGEDTVFDHIVTGLGNLVALPFETISSIMDGVGDFIGLLSEGNTGAMLTFVTILGALAVFGVSAGAGALAGIFSGIAAALTPIILPALAVASAVLLLKNVFENLGALFETGDLGTFIGDTLAGMASDLASFVGLDIDATEISNNIRITFAQIGYVIQLAVQSVINNIADGLRAVVASAITSLNDARFRLAQATGTAGADATEFFAVGDALTNLRGVDFFNAINEQLIGAADPTSLQNQLVANYTTVMQNFNALLPDIVAGNVNADQISAVLGTVINAGQLGNALASAAQGGALQPFLDSLLTIPPDALANVNFSDLASQIAGFVSIGSINADAANAFINNLLLSGSISPEQAQTMLDSVSATVAQQAALTTTQVDLTVQPEVTTVDPVATETAVTTTSAAVTTHANDHPPITNIPVTASPTVTVDPVATTQAVTDTTQAVTDAATNAPPTEVSLNVGFGLGEGASAEDIALVNNNITTLNGNVAILQTTIATFIAAPEVLAFMTMLTDMNTGFTDITTSITETQTAATDFDLQVGVVATDVATFLLDIQSSFLDFQTNSILAITAVKDEMTAFREEVSIAVGTIDALSGSLSTLASLDLSVNASGTTTGATTGNHPPGRATGGPVLAGQIYQVVERGQPEVFQSGQATYLISPNDGYVTPLPITSTANQQIFSAPPVTSPSGATTNNSNSIVVTEGDIQIVIPNSVNAADPQAIGEYVRKAIRENRSDTYNIRDRLRSAGRSG